MHVQQFKNSSEKCPAGTKRNPGKNSCTQCEENTISKAGATFCTPCPAGTVANEERTKCGQSVSRQSKMATGLINEKMHQFYLNHRVI